MTIQLASFQILRDAVSKYNLFQKEALILDQSTESIWHIAVHASLNISFIISFCLMSLILLLFNSFLSEGFIDSIYLFSTLKQNLPLHLE